MGTVKIRLNTWERCGNRDTKFKRYLAPREGFVDYDLTTKKVTLKEGSTKWKPLVIPGVSMRKNTGYIQDRKDMYSGLCFENRTDAMKFMKKHAAELDRFAKSNPLFHHWSIMNVINRFEPTNKKIYGKDIKE